MTPRKTATRRPGRHVRALFALSFLFLSIAATASDQVWVRIHHAASDPAVAEFGLQSSLNDYGSMQWGRVSAQQAAELEAAGLRISIETNPFILDLGGERFDPVDASPMFEQRQADPNGDFHLIQFDGPIRPEWLSAVRASGLALVQPLHPFSYIVWAESGQMSAARTHSSVRFAGPMMPAWKVQPHLRDFDATPRATMALASAHVDQRELWSELGRYGQVHAITPLNRHFSIVHIDLPGNDYQRLADLPAIYTVQYIRPETGPRGEMSNQSIVGNYDGAGVVFPGYVDWLNSTGYDGAGVTVGVVDGGIRTTHVDLADRMVPCVPSGDSPTSCTTASDNHGTHVAGAVAGTGATGTLLNGFLRGQGVAPSANLVQQRYGAFLGSGPGQMIPDGMLKIYRESALSGALLTNNSWGPTGSPQGYDIPTQQIDFISRDADPATPGDQPVLAVWSIMNGNGDNNSSACGPSSLGSPDEAKNLFAVGSTSMQNTSGTQLANIFRISTNSAHGNACDGRRVPHIVAPGCQTDSTSSSSNTAHGFLCGTSMASPVASGAIAVWAEKYIAQTGTNPSPALVKAVFTAAAQDLVGNQNADGGIMGHRPDRFQGYGRLDLDLVMNHGVEVFTVDQEEVFTATGQDWSIGLNAVDPSQPIRIMLAWTDAPGHGMGGTTPAWVNNLDLVVEASGNTYLGNIIGADGWSATGGSPDDRNNLEGVFLSPAQHGGAVNVTVNASNISADALNPWDPADPSQDFALACYNCIVGDPTFSISLNPTVLEACVPESGSTDFPVNVNLSNIGVYSGTVQLSVPNSPAGISNSFDPASVSVPGTSNWTLNVGAATTPGNYQVTVAGDDGENVHTRDLNLLLDAPLNIGPALLGPIDGASDTSLTPIFSWDTLPNVEDYRIQVATDLGFGTIVIDESLSSTSFTPISDLNTGTEYFWRVQGSNLCGGGEWSTTFGFTTRLEPEAVFSAESFSFFMSGNQTNSAMLEISNIGTGNLTWSIETDQLEAADRDNHLPALDEALALPNFNLPGQGSASASAEAGLSTRGTVIGLTFEGSVSGISGNGTWASDMIMTVTSPDGTIFAVGGFSTGNPPWDFDGSGSSNDGTYTSTHIGTDVFGAEGVDDVGEWQFAFQHTWNDAMSWSDVTVTLHKLPPPFCDEELTNVDWMSVSPSSGSTPAGDSDLVQININTAGLSAGNYLGYLCVSTNDPAASLVAIPVELDVVAGDGPIASVSPASFDFQLLSGDSDSANLTIGNIGNEALNWDLFDAGNDASCFDPLIETWLTSSLDNGIVPAENSMMVQVAIDTAGLADGNYSTSLCLTTNDPAAQLISIPVNLSVTTAAEFPIAEITPAAFNFTLDQGTADTNMLSIGNSGEAALEWEITAALQGRSYRQDESFPIGFNAPQGADRASHQSATSGQADARIEGTIFGNPVSGDWNEGFDDITTLPGAGWSLINNSDPVGTTSWFQGNPDSFEAHGGSTNSYIAANFNNTAGGTGTISNWLLTPEIELQNGTEIRFWSRTPTDSSWADRLEVRLSTSGASGNVGSEASDVGDFTEVLLTINESLAVSGYPQVWTEYVIQIEGLSTPASGRVGLRYYVTQAGPTGTNSNYIGIDSFSVSQPELAGCNNPNAVSWLELGGLGGTTLPGATPETVTVGVSAAGLAAGNYLATLCIATNDPDAALVEVPVMLDVMAVEELFSDRFEGMP